MVEYPDCFGVFPSTHVSRQQNSRATDVIRTADAKRHRQPVPKSRIVPFNHAEIAQVDVNRLGVRSGKFMRLRIKYEIRIEIAESDRRSRVGGKNKPYAFDLRIVEQIIKFEFCPVVIDGELPFDGELGKRTSCRVESFKSDRCHAGAFGFAADFEIGSFGAKADGRVQTQAIQSAIDAASAAGGGTVVVPRGTYVSGALFFRPGVDLRIDEGGVLKGSTEILDFPMMMTRIEGETRKYFPALVNADRCDGFRLTGKGVIDGSGGPYWKRLVIRWQSRGGCENIDEQRPRLVYVSNSTNVTVSGVTLRDSPFWTLHLYRCKDVLVENARIEAGTWEGVQNENADAIDFDGVRNVTVRGCSFDVHNDALTTKGGKGPLVHLPGKAPDAEPNDGLLVENCAFGPQCTGCLTLGSECFAAKDIIMRNCRVSNPTCVLRLKMRNY